MAPPSVLETLLSNHPELREKHASLELVFRHPRGPFRGLWPLHTETPVVYGEVMLQQARSATDPVGVARHFKECGPLRKWMAEVRASIDPASKTEWAPTQFVDIVVAGSFSTRSDRSYYMLMAVALRADSFQRQHVLPLWRAIDHTSVWAPEHLPGLNALHHVHPGVAGHVEHNAESFNVRTACDHDRC